MTALVFVKTRQKWVCIRILKQQCLAKLRGQSARKAGLAGANGTFHYDIAVFFNGHRASLHQCGRPPRAIVTTEDVRAQTRPEQFLPAATAQTRARACADAAKSDALLQARLRCTARGQGQACEAHYA